MQVAVWVPVFSALLSSLLTGAILISQEFLRGHRQEKAARENTRDGAYHQLLVTSGLMVQSASTLRTLIQTRNGLAEAVDLLLHIRRPVDLFQLDQLMRGDLTPLFEAWSLVWTVGSREGIQISNELVAKASEIVQMAITPGTERGLVRTLLLGPRWRSGELNAMEEKVKELSATRRKLALLARKEGGAEFAEVYSVEIEESTLEQPLRKAAAV